MMMMSDARIEMSLRAVEQVGVRERDEPGT